MSKIKPRADGRYSVKRKIDGKIRYFYGASQEEAEDKARAAGAHSITRADTFETWLNYWLENVVCPNVDKETYKNYTSLVKTHITGELCYLGKMKLKDITTQDLRQFITAKLKDMKPNSTIKLHMFIKASLAMAAADGIILKSPAATLKRPKVVDQQHKYLHNETVRKLIETCRFKKHKALILVAWTAGLRREELLGLYWTDIDKGRITVRRAVKKGRQIVTELKTPNAYRTIPIPRETIATLEAWKREQALKKGKVVRIDAPPLVFPDDDDPYEPIVVTRWFTRLCKKIGLDADLYDLRHTFATNLAVKGVHPSKIQYLMGHSNPSMAIKVYTHINVEHLDDIPHIIEECISENKEVVIDEEAPSV